MDLTVVAADNVHAGRAADNAGATVVPPPPLGSMDQWSTQEVVDWASAVNGVDITPEIEDNFWQHGVTGHDLRLLQRDDLKELGITIVPQIRQLLQAIHERDYEDSIASRTPAQDGMQGLHCVENCCLGAVEAAELSCSDVNLFGAPWCRWLQWLLIGVVLGWLFVVALNMTHTVNGDTTLYAIWAVAIVFIAWGSSVCCPVCCAACCVRTGCANVKLRVRYMRILAGCTYLFCFWPDDGLLSELFRHVERYSFSFLWCFAVVALTIGASQKHGGARQQRLSRRATAHPFFYPAALGVGLVFWSLILHYNCGFYHCNDLIELIVLVGGYFVPAFALIVYSCDTLRVLVMSLRGLSPPSLAWSRDGDGDTPADCDTHEDKPLLTPISTRRLVPAAEQPSVLP
jgi:hypothetical protein